MKGAVSFIIYKTSSYTEIIMFLPVHTSAKSLRLCKVSEGACLYYINTVIVLEKIKRPFLRDADLFVVDKQLNTGVQATFVSIEWNSQNVRFEGKRIFPFFSKTNPAWPKIVP